MVIGLIRWISAKREHHKTPIIAMTAYGEEHLKEAIEVGATATLRKPDEVTDLPQIVNRLLGKNKRDISESGKSSVVTSTG